MPKTIDEIREELAEECAGWVNPMAAFKAGFDKRGEIGREEIERLNNAYESMAGAARRLEKMWEEQRANEEKLKRVIEIQKGGLEYLKTHKCFDCGAHTDAAETLKEAAAILNGEKK